MNSKNGAGGRPGWDGEKSRTLILEALLDLPLGASLRDVARHVGKHVNTVQHHVKRMRKTGHVEIIRRGYKQRAVVVPVRVRLGDEERAWLKLGSVTARAIVVVARAGGRRVSSAEVARELGWRAATAGYHLQRARAAGILEARHGAGYTLACACQSERERAGLDDKAFAAVAYVAAQAGRRVSAPEIAHAHDWTLACAKYHLKRAVKADLLTVRQSAGYALSAGAERVNWNKSGGGARA